jgi:hypothetical protein
MALKSWSIRAFDGTLPETKELLDSDSDTIVTLSLLVSNNEEEDDANVTLTRVSSSDVVKTTWAVKIPAGSGPFALDSMLVFAGGDKLNVTSDVENVSVDANGHQE